MGFQLESYFSDGYQDLLKTSVLSKYPGLPLLKKIQKVKMPENLESTSLMLTVKDKSLSTSGNS